MRVSAVLICLLIVAALACDNGTTGPSATDLTGTWTGTSTYPNAPFQLIVTQTGNTIRGQYSDALDRSISVTGTLTNPAFTIVVDFGDAKLNLNGTVMGPRRATGVMFTSALGNREYPFEMTR